MKTKYAIQKLGCYFDDGEIFKDDSSIEHILPETAGECALNIGNLILLETKINNEAGNNIYTDKVQFYKQSHYSWINKFVDKNKEWDSKMIEERAERLAAFYYYAILKRELPKSLDISVDEIV